MSLQCPHLARGDQRTYQELGGQRWCLDCAAVLQQRGPAYMAQSKAAERAYTSESQKEEAAPRERSAS